jgi:6-phosphofructokinase 1
MQRIGILTSGGDAPGMNAAIRAAVRTASRHGIESIGVVDGYSGLVHGQYIGLGDRDVGDIIQRGGTILGTSRSPEFREPAGRERAARTLKEAGIDAIIAIGGDGTFRGALSLAQEHGILIAGLPGTIDNDVAGTEESIGFHTAVQTAVTAIDRLRDTGESTATMFFVEVMGRHSGALAVTVAAAAGASAIFVPGACEEIAQVAQQLRDTSDRGKRSHIVIVSEGDEVGGAVDVAKAVSEHIDLEYRVTVLGHIQRGGDPVARDRIVATWGGHLAVEALLAGRSGFMIGMQAGSPVEVPLEDVVSNQPPPFDDRLFQLALAVAG